MKHKIPCSIGIITLNSGRTLRKCLSNLKDFKEIIICDGNSTDDTIKIAKEFGCRVIPQYSSAKKNIKAKDKSLIRNKTIDQAKEPWYFYIDSDDQIDKKAVDSIRKITTSKDPKHLIWRINCKIRVHNKIIQHSASYPDRRIVLIHKSTRARFHKPEHEKIKYDKNEFSEGLIQGTMYLQWDKSRLGKKYWNNANQQIQTDFNATKDQSLKQFIQSSLYFNFKTIIYFLIKPFFIYAKYGYKNAMPYSVEIKRAQYHAKLMAKHIQHRLFKTK